MVFSSAIFLWLFLPVTFVLNCIAKERYSNALLVLASFIFYAWGEPVLVVLLAASVLVNWLVGRAMDRFPKRKGLLLLAGVALDLAALGYYKYAGFFAETVNLLFGRQVMAVPQIALPIGISFFTFQAIAYITDVYRGQLQPQPKLLDMALYLSFFPQLVQGPILRYGQIGERIASRKITREGVAAGTRRFIYGLAKKVLIANTLGLCVDTVYGYIGGSISAIDGKMAWIGALMYTFQIYYDFSGYSDMAVGLGKLFGFDIPENFNYPYLSRSIGEFWRRWHISLGAWFREYVYIPLGGNKKGKARTYLNLAAVFFLTGLWHGASFSFILWGLYHGLFSILERMGLKKFLDKHGVLGGLYCFLAVHFGWVFFRVARLSDALAIIRRLLLPWQYDGLGMSVWEYMDWRTVFAAVCAVIGAGLLQRAAPKALAERWKGSAPEALFCGGLLILCLASMASNTYNPFIYFQF